MTDKLIEAVARAAGVELYGAVSPETTPNCWGNCTNVARAAIAAIEAAGYRVVPVSRSHLDALCPECGTMGSDHAAGCAAAPKVINE